MWPRLLTLLLASVCGIVLCSGQPADSVAIDGELAHPTRVLAKLRPVATAQSHASILSANNLQVVEVLDSVPGLVVLDDDPSVPPMAAAAQPGTSAAEARAERLERRLAVLRASGMFEYVEPDWLVAPATAPTDFGFVSGALWGLRNSGQDGGVPGVDIDAERAWSISTGSNTVIVAVIDTGIRSTHLDLATQMWRNPGEIAGNGVDDDRNGYVDDVHGINAINGSGAPADADGHGTHVAGTIGAAANNDGDHVGVAWNVRLMACKFMGEQGGGFTSDAIESIEYAVEHGARILNCSWGGRGYSRSLEKAIEAAGRRGALVIAAAGNSRMDNDRLPHFPAAFEASNIISVAAIDRRGNLASFSNYGSRSVDLAAPGVDIFSTFADSDQSYFVASGTSMAAPHVAGVAALVRSRFPGSSFADVRDRIVNTAMPSEVLRGITASGGRLNAYAALTGGEDGALRVFLQPNGGTVVKGRVTRLVARVVDVVGVRGATVVGRVNGAGTFRFRDDGLAPDLVADDGEYTGTFTAPETGENVTISVDASVPGRSPGLAEAVYALRAPPANDDFANRIALPLSTSLTQATNRGATRELGEPAIFGHRGGASVWWTWTAVADASVAVSTNGSDFDTVLGVFTGDQLEDLVEVASNDNEPGHGGASAVAFAAVAGVTYHIAVDGWEGATGDITLSLRADAAPPNDLFANRTLLEGASGSATSIVNRSTVEPGEPQHLADFQVASSSIWWSWTPPVSGTARLRAKIRGQWQTHALIVYEGSELESLRRLPTRVTEGSTGYEVSVTVAVAAGRTYAVAVVSVARNPVGDCELTWEIVPGPPNDHFDQRTIIAGSAIEVAGTTEAATREVGEPQHAGNGDGATVWWSWTAPGTGTLDVIVPERQAVAGVAVYTGGSVASLTPVGRSAYSSQSSNVRLAVPTVAGTTYAIAAEGDYGALFTLQVSWGLAPANDMFANAAVVAGVAVTLTGDNTGASREVGEPDILFGSGNTLWWRWTAPWTGTVVLKTEQRNDASDHVVDVFTGTTLANLDREVITARSLGSGRYFRALGGETYYLAVDGRNGQVGPIDVKFFLREKPSNDDFADRLRISGQMGDSRVSAAFATCELGENPSEGGTLWWTWTAPTSEPTSIRVTGARPTGKRIRLFTGSDLRNLTAVRSGFASKLEFIPVGGTTYQIQVGWLSEDEGDLRLLLQQGRPPINDSFANRNAISAAGGTFLADLRTATREEGEPSPSLSSGASAWWTWTAPKTGRVMISAFGSPFRLMLNVYIGSELSSLIEIATNSQTPDGPVPHVVFDAHAGTTYQIALDGYGGDVGTVTAELRYTSPPTNDRFINRIALSGAHNKAYGSNIGASPEESNYSNAAANVWWTWTAPATGLTAVHTGGSAIDTRLRVFTGNALDQLKLIGFNDDRDATDRSSLVIFQAVEGVAYQIEVDGAWGAMGEIALEIVMGGPPVAPPTAFSFKTIDAGGVLELEVDGLPAGVAVEWLHDGAPIAGASGSNLVIPSLQSFHAGTYALRLTNVFGAVVSAVAAVDVDHPAPSHARLTNLSTRALVSTADSVLIPGFVVAGPGSKRLLIRAVGPTLAAPPFKLAGTLPNPRLALKRFNGAGYDDVVSNDEWGSNINVAELLQRTSELGSFPLLEGSADAALLVELEPGQYSVVTDDPTLQSGLAIVEFYDADETGTSSRLANISTRGYVGVGDSIMIPGFVVSSEGPKTLLIRVVGPTLGLSPYNVTGALADPTLAIYRHDFVNNTDDLILTNDNWSASAGADRTRDVAAQVHAFALPEGSKDAAFVVTLNPGVYTVHARGKNDTTGVALVEVYAVE